MPRITVKRWEGYARRLERQNLHKHGRSRWWGNIATNSRSLAACNGDGTVDVVDGWREAMREAANDVPVASDVVNNRIARDPK